MQKAQMMYELSLIHIFFIFKFYGPHFLWGSSSSAFPGGRLHHQICASPFSFVSALVLGSLL